MKKVLILTASFVVLHLSSCDQQYPKDPENTLEKVEEGILRAGITEAPPYVIFNDGGEPAGIEVEIIKEFAKQLNARIEWTKGSESTILELLKERELDICAGGFSSKSVWKKHVHFATPHDTLVYTWGVPSGAIPDEIEDNEVHVKKGTIAGALAAKNGANTQYKDDFSGDEPIIVAPAEELQKMGYLISEETMKEEMISFAIQKGENAFLERLTLHITKNEKGN